MSLRKLTGSSAASGHSKPNLGLAKTGLAALMLAVGLGCNATGERQAEIATFVEQMEAQRTSLLFSDIAMGPVGSMVTVWTVVPVAPDAWRCGGDPCPVVRQSVETALTDSYGFVGPIYKSTIKITESGGPIQINGDDEYLPFSVVNGRIREAEPQSLQKILSGAKYGDVIYLREGVYTPTGKGYGNAVIWAENVNGVAVIGWPGESAVLMVGDAPGFDSVGNIEGWTVANLEFTSKTGRGMAIQSGRKGRRQNFRIVGNYAHDLAIKNSGAFGAWTNTKGLLIAGNRSSQTGVAQSNNSHVIYHGGRGSNHDVAIVYNSIADHQGGRAIQIFGHSEGESMTGLLIKGNIISNVIGQSDGILISHSDRRVQMPPHDPRKAWINDATVTGNRIDNVSRFGISIRAAKADVVISNNAVGKSGAGTIYVDFSRSALISDNCLASAPRVNSKFSQEVTIENNATDFPDCIGQKKGRLAPPSQ